MLRLSLAALIVTAALAGAAQARPFDDDGYYGAPVAWRDDSRPAYGEVQRIVLPLRDVYTGETLDLSRLATANRRLEGWSIEGVEIGLGRDRNFGDAVLLQDGYRVDGDSLERRSSVVLRPRGGGVIGQTIHRLDLQISGRAAIRDITLTVRAPDGPPPPPRGPWRDEPPPAWGAPDPRWR